MYISQSLIKTMFHRFDELPDSKICFRKIYSQYVLGLRTKPSLSNKYGLFFEDLACGTNYNNIVLPKHARTGKKLSMEIRLSEQANIFKEWCREVDGFANEANSQITIYKKWPVDPTIILSGKLDIFPFPMKTLNLNTGELIQELCILDLKYTANLSSTYGKFCWGEPQRMDHLQAIHYLSLVENIDFDLNDRINPGNLLRQLVSDNVKYLLDNGYCKFKYYVADGQSNYSSDLIEYQLKPDDKAQHSEVIRKTVRLLRQANDEEWPANPSSENCLGNPKEGVYECPFTTCSYRCHNRTI